MDLVLENSRSSAEMGLRAFAIKDWKGKGLGAEKFQILLAEHEFQRSFSGQPSKIVVEANSRSRDSLVFLSEGSPRGLVSIGP